MSKAEPESGTFRKSLYSVALGSYAFILLSPRMNLPFMCHFHNQSDRYMLHSIYCRLGLQLCTYSTVSFLLSLWCNFQPREYSFLIARPDTFMIFPYTACTNQTKSGVGWSCTLALCRCVSPSKFWVWDSPKHTLARFRNTIHKTRKPPEWNTCYPQCVLWSYVI